MRWPLPVLVLGFLAVSPLPGQVPIFLSGAAGGAFNTSDNVPGGSGGGFAFQAGAGLFFPRIAVGAEYGQYAGGGNFKTRTYGGVVRLPSFGEGPVRLYLAVGLGAYQFIPATGASSTSLGASLGPGARIALGSPRAAAQVEVRFHSTFDRLPRINRQQYLALVAGLELRL